MSVIQFDNFNTHDISEPLTLDRTFRLFGTFSGLSRYQIDNLFDLDLVGWEGDLEMSLGGTLNFDATGLLDLNANIHTLVDLPPTHAFSYHKFQYDQGVVVGYNPDTGNHFLVTTNNSGYPRIYKWVNDSYQVVQSIDKDTPEEADVMVSYTQQEMSDGDYWHGVSLYMNGALVTTYIERSGQPVGRFYFGFYAPAGSTASYSNIVISDLSGFAEWNMLEPGVNPMQGLQQTLEGRYISFFARYDDQLRAWRPRAVESAQTLTADDDLYESGVQIDQAKIYNHIRMVGAYTWAEKINETSIVDFEHRFAEVNNSMLFSEAECAYEAERTLKRSEEDAFGESVASCATPYLELDDRITTPNGDWLIDSIQWGLDHGYIQQQIDARKYVWGD